MTVGELKKSFDALTDIDDEQLVLLVDGKFKELEVAGAADVFHACRAVDSTEMPFALEVVKGGEGKVLENKERGGDNRVNQTMKRTKRKPKGPAIQWTGKNWQEVREFSKCRVSENFTMSAEVPNTLNVEGENCEVRLDIGDWLHMCRKI